MNPTRFQFGPRFLLYLAAILAAAYLLNRVFAALPTFPLSPLPTFLR